MTFDEIADLLIEWAVHEPRVRALWIEAPVARELRRPYPSLEVHITSDEPDFPSLWNDLHRKPELLSVPDLRLMGTADTPRFAKELKLRTGELSFLLIAEQSYLLAKRPRAAVVPLLDKTGHLAHVLDYSRKSG